MKKEDILYVEVDNRKIIIHSKKIVIDGSLTSQLGILLPSLGLVRARVNKFVNMDNILRRDKKKSLVYFDKEETLSCNVSREHKHKFFW